MKKTILPLALFLVLGTSVYAQETSVATSTFPQKREEIKQRIEEKRIELQPQIQEKREEVKKQISEHQGEIKTKLQVFAQERVSKVLMQIFERFEAVLVKFDGIVIRIENRIAKLNEQEVDTVQSEVLLEVAKKQIEDSTSLIAASKIELEASITNEISKENIKKTLEICKTSLKETQKALIVVIGSMKDTGESEEELLIE